MNVTVDLRDFAMRSPCPRCNGQSGYVVDKNGQDTVRCNTCDSFCYNAPRTETGREARTATTVHNGVRPKLRSKILERDGHRCVLCHTTEQTLHAGHVVSVGAGIVAGLSDAEINDEENLIAMCEECNLGQGEQPISLSVAIRILKARISWRNRHEAS